MIRKLQEPDLDKVADIWLTTNISAHSFIDAQYWYNNFQAVEKMLSQAEIYIYEDENKNKIQGFVGLNNDYIAGIFVRKEKQSNGIGKQLLDFIKNLHTQLTLNVYKKNTQAIKFYHREGFKIKNENIDEDVGEKEYEMIWER